MPLDHKLPELQCRLRHDLAFAARGLSQGSAATADGAADARVSGGSVEHDRVVLMPHCQALCRYDFVYRLCFKRPPAVAADPKIVLTNYMPGYPAGASIYYLIDKKG
jgi:hypothetical protein